MARSQEELIDRLRNSFDALRASGAAFDAGKLWEAERLATAVANLVHDNLNKRIQTKSILTQLGLRGSLRFTNSAKSLDWAPSVALAGISMSDEGTSYIPLCQMTTDLPWLKQSQFVRWWEEVVFRDSASGRSISRKNIVMTFRDQDGGSHLDENITNEAYVQLMSQNDPRVSMTIEGVNQPIPNAHFASMRQIAWEVEQTLKAVVG